MSNPIRLTVPLITAAGLALGAMGCMTDHNAAQASMARYGLYYSESQDEGAKLAYGLENSDDLSFMLVCKKRSGQIHVLELYGAAKNGPLVLTSAGKRAVLNGKHRTDDEFEDGVVEAATVSTTPALVGFHETGKLDVSGKGFRYNITAKTDGQAEVSRFFDACGTV